MSGRIYITNQYVGRRKAAFHAALISEKSSADPPVIPDPSGLHDTADIQDNYHLREILRDRLCQSALRVCKAEVTVLKQAL